MSASIVLTGRAIRITRGSTAMGKPYLKFTAYTPRKDRSGGSKNDFYDVFYFGAFADSIRASEKDRVYVSGRLVLEEYTARDGTRRIRPTIFADRVEFSSDHVVRQSDARKSEQEHSVSTGDDDDVIDDIPF